MIIDFIHMFFAIVLKIQHCNSWKLRLSQLKTQTEKEGSLKSVSWACLSGSIFSSRIQIWRLIQTGLDHTWYSIGLVKNAHAYTSQWIPHPLRKSLFQQPLLDKNLKIQNKSITLLQESKKDVLTALSFLGNNHKNKHCFQIWIVLVWPT